MSFNLGYVLEIPQKHSGILMPRLHSRAVKLKSQWGSIMCVCVCVCICGVGTCEYAGVLVYLKKKFVLSAWGDSVI